MRYLIALLALLGGNAWAVPQVAPCETFQGDQKEVRLLAQTGYTLSAWTFSGTQAHALMSALAAISEETTPQEVGQERVTIRMEEVKSIFAIAYTTMPEVLLRFYSDDDCLYTSGTVTLSVWVQAQLLI